MRTRRPLGVNTRGLLILTAWGGGPSILSASLFLFRAESEPVLRFVVQLFASRRGHYRYDPDDYFFWAGLVAFLALSGVALTIWVAWRQPAEDKRIDAALRSRLQPASRGAPLEPK